MSARPVAAQDEVPGDEWAASRMPAMMPPPASKAATSRPAVHCSALRWCFPLGSGRPSAEYPVKPGPAGPGKPADPGWPEAGVAVGASGPAQNCWVG
jgi:hypothetical protein